jgi:thioredoxin-like negative regulator of GroEL
MSMIVHDEDGLMAEITDPSTPLVVNLGAPWCKFCTMMEPHISRLADERAGSIRFAKCDNDKYPDVGDALKVKTLPLVILYKDGMEVARRGSGDHEQLSAWLAEHAL